LVYVQATFCYLPFYSFSDNLSIISPLLALSDSDIYHIRAISIVSISTDVFAAAKNPFEEQDDNTPDRNAEED